MPMSADNCTLLTPSTWCEWGVAHAAPPHPGGRRWTVWQSTLLEPAQEAALACAINPPYRTSCQIAGDPLGSHWQGPHIWSHRSSLRSKRRKRVFCIPVRLHFDSLPCARLEVIGTAYGLQTSPEVTLTHRQVTAGTSEACEYLRNWHTERHGGCSHLSGFPRAGTLIMSRRPKRADPGNFADAGIATHRVERRSDLGGQTSAVRLDVTAPPVRASIRMTLLSGFPLREKSAAL